MSSLPDTVASSDFVTSEPVPIAPPSADLGAAPDAVTSLEDDDDDPVVRTIDVCLSPALSDTLRLLQFPIQPAYKPGAKSNHVRRDNTPAGARIRPVHDMLELDYPVPPTAQGGHRQLSDKMCLSQRTFTSTSIAPVTHMALARLNKSGDRLDVIPMRRRVLQMRPSFRHLHDEEDDEPAADQADARPGRARPVMFQKKESERAAAAKRNSYAFKRAQEEGEEWIELEVHGGGRWSELKKELFQKVKCPDKENGLRVAANPKSADEDGGYVKSLNYLDTVQATRSSGEGFVEDLSEWAPSAAGAQTEDVDGVTADMDAVLGDLGEPQETTPSASIGETERAAAELAAKLAVLLQNGNGAMVPYCTVRSRFRTDKVSDEVLVMALSACAVLVRGNFALKSSLAKFIAASGGGEARRVLTRELRDLILLLLNMHGSVQRERLVRAYAVKADRTDGYGMIDAETVTFILETVARPATDCWVAKVDDDEGFAGEFPEQAACHAVYWMKKKGHMAEMLELYENAEPVDDKFC